MQDTSNKSIQQNTIPNNDTTPCLCLWFTMCPNTSSISMDDLCPINNLFSILGKKWMLYIVIFLSKNSGNFNLLMKKIPWINSKILSDRLDLLINEGYVLRHVTGKKPLKITYNLTEKWKELVLMLIYIWENFLNKIHTN